MSDIVAEPERENVIRVIPSDREVCPNMREWLGEVVERYGKGDIKNIAVILDDGEKMTYEYAGQWRNKWHLLGAIEYAKHMVLHG